MSADIDPKSRDPYESGIITTVSRISRAPAVGRFVGVLDSRREGRGLVLIRPRTRCIRSGEIHELIVTDERDAAPGGTVQRCHYLGFVEFVQGCVLVEGDRVKVGEFELGTLAGFDESHFPNHYNIVIKGPTVVTGVQLGQRPGDEMMFYPSDEEVRFAKDSS